jgi:excisionase family DNA binding protein
MSASIDLLTIDEVSERLQISKSWIYGQLALNRFPHVKLGRALRFRESDVARYVEEHLDRGSGVFVGARRPLSQ